MPSISKTSDWMSLSVIRLMCPLRTFLSHICNGFEPIEYRIEKFSKKNFKKWKKFFDFSESYALIKIQIEKCF